MQPTRPSHVSEHAASALEALAAVGLGHTISLGGAFGLLHYLDHRPTHDVDAWWAPSATIEDRSQVIHTIEKTLAAFGEVQTRQWGEVVSVEIRKEGRTVFSFQIATRSAQIEPPTVAPWTDVSLDRLPDLVASKMVALVERGAPRDFRDIHALCDSGLVTARECWRLWAHRQHLAGSDADARRARLALETHLARIAQHRPLDQITEPAQRAAAERVRTWFTTEFLDALVD